MNEALDPPHLVTDARNVPWPPDSAFWSKFENLTTGGKEPQLFRGLLPTDFPGPDEVDAAIRRLHATPERARVRVYVDVEKQPDLRDRFYTTPLSEEPAFDSLRRVTETDRVGLVVNDMQVWSERLTCASGTLLESMFLARGMPPGGAELVLFAGNYAGTPFGAHRGYEHAFLLHLGPAKKQFHLWSEASYLRLTGGLLDVHDYEPLLADAETVTLCPGDALYLPAFWFHIGTLDAYSASVAVSLYDYTPLSWLSRQCDNLAAALHRPPAFLIDYPGDHGHPERASPYLPATVDQNPLAAHIQPAIAEAVENIIPVLAEAHWYRHRSNAGFGRGPKQQGIPAEKLALDAKIRLVSPFQCCWSSPEPGKLTVYLRGRGTTVKYRPDLPDLLRRLNTFETVTMMVLRESLSEEWSDKAFHDFMVALARTGGIELVSDK